MGFNAFFDIYERIASNKEKLFTRKMSFNLRKRAFYDQSIIIKNAFDTRRINQETDYNPRRGLQNYHRSEPFVSKHMKEKIEAFSRLSLILNDIKSDYGREYEWQDSYARVLHSSVEKALRVKEGDSDFSDVQPSMASLDYLDELIYVRYRLNSDSLMTMSEKELRDIILNKDDVLISNGFNKPVISKADVTNYSYDGMMEKMIMSMSQVFSQMKPQDDLTTKLFDVKATKDNPDIERTVTINIKDKLNSSLEKVSEDKNLIKDTSEEKE